MNNQITKIFNAAIYVRLSKEDGDVSSAIQAESNSISNQKALIEDYLKDKKEIKIVSVRADDGYSGSNFDRPAFQLMMQDIKEGRVNCVVVKDLSRFGREYIDTGKYIERLFPALGVRFIAVNDNYDSMEGKSPGDEIIIPFKNLINDAYCRDISIKIRSNLDVKRKRGEFTGAFATYGYTKSEVERNKLVIDEYAASVVKDIFRWKIQGMSQDAIANKLNSLGILSPMEYKNSIGIPYETSFKENDQAKWGSVTVRRILENEIYLGTLIQGKFTTPNHKIKKVIEKPKEDWAVTEDAHEAIVSSWDFEIVRRLLNFDTRTSPYQDRVYLFAGIAVCGDCGEPMTRKTSSVGGKQYAYYMCSNHKNNKKCTSHRIQEDKLEQAVFQVVRNLITNLLHLDTVVDYAENIPYQELDVKKMEQHILKKQEEMDKYQKLGLSLYEDLKDGILSKEEYLEIKEQFQNKRKDAETAVANLEKELKSLLENKSDKYEWIEHFRVHKDMENLTRSIVVELIKEIRVFEDKEIEVEFQFADCIGRMEQIATHMNEMKEKNRKEAV